MATAEQYTIADRIGYALDELVQKVSRSLVMVRNGRYGAGAGVVWREGGVILTNNHVAARGRLKVVLPDGREVPAEVIDRDPEVDLALLKMDAGYQPVALVADSRAIRVGELVLAIGHPWGQRNTVTMGVVSALGFADTRGPRKLVPIIRSDVILAPGNSGGPLVNAGGGVVGINTMIVGGDQGVAIPSQVACEFVAEALDRRVVLGVGVEPAPLPAGAASPDGNLPETGALVVHLTPGGPAERAGLLLGDILVEFDGVALAGPRALLRALAARTPGERVPIGLLRGGRWRRLETELDRLE